MALATSKITASGVLKVIDDFCKTIPNKSLSFKLRELIQQLSDNQFPELMLKT